MDENVKKLKIVGLKKQLSEISNKLEASQYEVDLLNHIIASMPGHIYWTDRKGHLLGCNDEQARNIGLSSRLDVIGKSIYDFQPKENADEIIANNKNIIQSGDPKIIEEPGNLANGNKKIYLSHKAPLKDGDGNIVGIIGISTDITDKKLLEEELKKEKETAKEKAKIADIYLSNILRYLPDNIYWMDREGRIIGCNEQQAKCFGLDKASDLIGKNIFDVAQILGWDNSIPKTIRANDERIMETKHGEMFEETVIVNGEERVYLAHKAPLCDENNHVIGIVGTGTDITDRKRMEKELLTAKEKAEEANIIKSDFIKNMQHDIRTPLSGLCGIADIMEHMVKDTELKEYINNIKSCSKELLSYCDSILDFSNIQHGNLPVLSKKFNCHSLITKVIVLEEPAAKLKGLGLVVDYPKCVSTYLIGDEHRIYRILVNLISNSIKFTEKGYVAIKVNEFKKNTEKRESIVQFTIKDTGIGMPEDKQKYIFEKFSRLAPSNKGRYKGLGLGLRIVKEFVDDLGGEIEVSSKINNGTTIVCTLPLKLPLIDKIAWDDGYE
jgi:two-component system aerobic respiration control sensor histidine kinase ArcB